MEFFLTLVIFVALLILSGNMASTRDRSVFWWVVIAIFTTPLLSILLLACLGQARPKTCPKCAEKIRAKAVLCRYCGHDFDPAAHHEPNPNALPTPQ